MSLLFENVELLGYTHQNNFFGEKSLFYSSTRTISIRGYVLDLASSNGVDGVFNGVNQLINQTKDFQDITINGQNFGRGKVKSFSVDAGNWVRYTQYQADIEVFLEVPIANINSPEFNGINISNKKLNLLKSFSENFSLNFDTQNKVLDGEHTIDIEYDADNKNVDLIRLAQTLATELLKTIPSHPDIAEGNYLTRQKYKVLNSENYNTVNGKCGFKRTFSYSTINNDKNYSFVRTHSIQIDENGIATASENCNIKGESDDPSLYDNALTGYNELINGAYSRCNTVFQIYKTRFNISNNLNLNFVSRGSQVNKFNGTITYDVVFDNDPKKVNSFFQWEYVQSLERNQEGVWTSSENGSVRGNGKLASDSKYTNAELGWTTAKNQIALRISNFYNAESKNGLGGTLKELSKNITRNRYEGVINYNYSYTDDPTVKQNDPDGVKKITIEKSDTGLLPIFKDFIIPNNTFALSQNRNLRKQGSYTVKVNMEVGCLNSNNNFNSYNYFNKARQQAGGKPNLGNDEYLESISYSSDEVEKTISYEATYKYS
jgi:hypothetical protein